ncbi:hypothetical protein ACP4OV_004489 [Aristida adscensionis]
MDYIKERLDRARCSNQYPARPRTDRYAESSSASRTNTVGNAFPFYIPSTVETRDDPDAINCRRSTSRSKRAAMGAQEDSCSPDLRRWVSWALAFVAVYCAVALLIVFLVAQFPSEWPAFSLAITGVAGLDPARDVSPAAGGPPPPLSPVFNLTVHVDNARDAWTSACFPTLAAAAVSYGDALLGRGTVPPFCYGPREQGEGGSTAWGQDVAVPRFLRERLAGELAVGEAAVDVQVTLPRDPDADWFWDVMLVCNNVKIGGGISPCRRRELYPPRPAEV